MGASRNKEFKKMASLGRRGVVVAAIVFAAFIALSEAGIEGLALMLAGLAVAAVAVFFEFRRRGRSVFGPLALLLMFSMLIPGISCFVAGLTPARALSCVLLLVSVPLLFARAPVTETLKGLHDFIGPQHVFESQDVQFTVLWDEKPVSPGGTIEVMVYAQSCVDGPRGVTIKVLPEEKFGIVRQRHEIDLEPGRIVMIKLPVPVPQTVPGQFWFFVDVIGYGGIPAERVRHAKGRQWLNAQDVSDSNVAGAVMLLAGGVGRMTLNPHGLIKVTIGAAAVMPTAPPPVSSTEIYRPTAEELTAASN